MTSELKDGILTISISGDLMGEMLNEPVMQLLQKNFADGNRKILFNLREMKFINSTGLGMLLTAVSKTRNAGGAMALCSLPEQMNRLLKMSKLESIFQIHPDEAAATAYLKAA